MNRLFRSFLFAAGCLAAAASCTDDILKQHPEVIEEMSKQAKKLTEKEYNAKTTASYIVNDFIQIAK